MTFSLQKKKCFITGAASGIGRATALRAAREGALLCVCDINQDGLDSLVAEIGKEQILASKAFDISDYDTVKAFADDIHQQHGSMDVIMNIAGISTWGAIDKLKNQHWRQLIEINLMGPIHVLECFVPEMMKAKRGGHIVNVSSAAGLLGLPLHAAYSATKFGIRGISEVLRFDLRQHNIHVSLVCPGAVNTGLVQTINIVGVDKNDPKVSPMIKRFQKHAATPERAAKAIMLGMQKKKYMVFTSWDIWAAYQLQCKLPFIYEGIMRLMSSQVMKLLK